MNASRRSHDGGVGGFTLIELLIAIGVMAALMGLLMPAIGSVRTAVRKTRTVSQIQSLQAALALYAIEDRRHWLPANEPDDTLRSTRGTAAAPAALDLLRSVGVDWPAARLGPAEATGRALRDEWGREVRYRADSALDGVIAKPAPRADWNAKGDEPYAYVWSLGAPSGAGDAADAAPAAAGAWIYTRTSP